MLRDKTLSVHLAGIPAGCPPGVDDGLLSWVLPDLKFARPRPAGDVIPNAVGNLLFPLYKQQIPRRCAPWNDSKARKRTLHPSAA